MIIKRVLAAGFCLASIGYILSTLVRYAIGAKNANALIDVLAVLFINLVFIILILMYEFSLERKLPIIKNTPVPEIILTFPFLCWHITKFALFFLVYLQGVWPSKANDQITLITTIIILTIYISTFGFGAWRYISKLFTNGKGIFGRKI